MHTISRRQLLRSAAVVPAGLALAELGLLPALAPVSAAEAKLPATCVRFDSDTEPFVRLLEETPRERLLEEVAARIRGGTSYREVLAGLLLAGVRNIQPRPVGFKFHAVLVVNSAHLASLNSPDADRWFPIFWALDQFKSAQARDVREGDWTMSAVEESAVPSFSRARRAFIEAMDNWDVAGADAAVAGLARSAGPQEIFELFVRYGARDFRDIGHKAIYVANSWRTLQNIGWQHAEPVLRSLAYALLEHEGDNPATRQAPADQPGRRNQSTLAKIRADWMAGKTDPGAGTEMLRALRQADATGAADKVVELLNRGVSPQSIWDGLFAAAGEWLMRKPGIVALHSVTTTNALHYAWEHTAEDQTRRWLLLQAASFLTLFREALGDATSVCIDELEGTSEAGSVAEIFADLTRDRYVSARKTLRYLQSGGRASEYIASARRLIYLKGTDSHDYKFSEAVLEDFFNVTPAVRDRFLAASVYNLRGASSPDNPLIQRTREAFKVG